MLIATFVGAAYGEVKSWSEVATKLSGRSNKDCRKRFYNEVTGGLKKVCVPRFGWSSYHNQSIPGWMDERRRQFTPDLYCFRGTPMGCYCPENEDTQC